MIRSIRLPAFLLAALTSTACATIMHGSRQDVSIASVPSGAAVTVNGQDRGKTPVSVELPRKDKHLLTIELPGYLPFESYLTRKVSGWVWGNLLFGGILGLAIDAITGGLYIVKPEDVTATLTTAPAAAVSSGAPSAASPTTRPAAAASVVTEPAPEPAASETRQTHVDGPAEGPATVALAGSRIRIVTDPAGADVFIGSTRVGTTGADGLVIELPAGRVVCRIEAAGFEPAERRFIVPEAPDAAGPLKTAIVVVSLRSSSR